MPEKYRTVLILRDMENFSTSEIAAIMNRKEATIRWRLAEARNMFQRLWVKRQGMAAVNGRKGIAMNCKQAKTQVALLIGNDLEPAALQEVRNHLGQCVGCRQHFERLSSCLEVLQTPPRSWNADDESLWPKLSARLASPNAGQKPHRLSGWAPTLAVAAACTAMFWVASSHWSANQPVGQPAIYSGSGTSAQPIGDPPAFDNGSSRTNRQGDRIAASPASAGSFRRANRI